MRFEKFSLGSIQIDGDIRNPPRSPLCRAIWKVGWTGLDWIWSVVLHFEIVRDKRDNSWRRLGNSA
jgi:hypothetical protein